MSLMEISPEVLLSYGQFALPLALVAGGIGVPLPGTLLLLATGALVQQGSLALSAVAALALFGVVIGDSGSYLLGRYGGPLMLRGASRGGWSGEAWRKASRGFEHRGGLTVFVTRFLLTPLALPTNLIAGGSGYSYRRFLAFDLAGETLWVGSSSGSVTSLQIAGMFWARRRTP